MKIYIRLLFTLSIIAASAKYSSIYAQTAMMDSLRNVLISSSAPKNKIDALNTIAFNLRSKKTDSAKIFSYQAIAWSKKENYHTGIGVACITLGNIHYTVDNDSALYYFKQAQQAFIIEPTNLLRTTRVLNGITNTYIQKTQFDSALYYANFTIDYIKNSKDTGKVKTERLMYAFGSLANTHYAASNYDKSIENYIKAGEIGEKINNIEMLVVYYSGIANIQGTLGNFEKAIQYGEKSIEAAQQVKDFPSLILSLANQGAYYLKLKKYESAKIFADSSIELGKLKSTQRYEGRNYQTLGQIKMDHNDCTSALHLYKTGLASNINHKGSAYSKFILQKEIANAYNCLDSFQMAIQFYLQSLKNGDGDADHMSNCYLGLAESYAKIDDGKNAYLYLRKYNIIHDSVFTVEKLKSINEANTKFETEKKELQLTALEKDKLLRELALKKSHQELINAGLTQKTLQQRIETAKLIAQKQEQQIEIQDLTLENKEFELVKQQMDLQKQQSDLRNANDRLTINQQEKAIQASVIKNQQTKFYLVLLSTLIAFLAGLFMFNRYKLNKRLESQQAIFSERSRLSQELHDEVGATLSGISMYSHLTKEQIKQTRFDEVQHSLNIMQSSASEMVNKLNDIVWLLNPEQDDLQKLLYRLEDYTRNMAAIKNMKATIKIPETLSGKQIQVDTRRNIYLFCKEAINNAVKYSNAGEIEFSAEETGNVLEINIHDNGIGFNKNEIKRGNGLANLQKRADELNADYLIHSTPGKGCEINLKTVIG